MRTKYTDKQRMDAYNKRKFYMEQGYNVAKNNDPLHIKACMLYWGEGTKNGKVFQFTNCDVNTHLVIMEFISTYFPQYINKIRCRINFYSSNENPYTNVVSYWSNKLNIPISNFTKPTDRNKYYSSPLNVKYPNGILRLSISSVEIIQHVYGAINYYSGNEVFTPNTGRNPV